MGRILRQGDAKLMLRRMNDAEASFRQKEMFAQQIEDRIQRLNFRQRMEADYLFRFGVPLSHRTEFRKTLDEVAIHGGLTLDEAALVIREQPDDHQNSSDRTTETIGSSPGSGDPQTATSAPAVPFVF